MLPLAIVCAGLDSVRRGYESHQRMLFQSLSATIGHRKPVLLFKRDGEHRPNEIVLGSFSRNSRVCRSLARLRGDTLYWESLFFTFAFLAQSVIRRHRYSTIAVIEPMVCKTLWRLKSILPGKPRIVFTHGVWNRPEEYLPYADEVQEVSVENYNASSTHALANGKVRLLPHFLPNAADEGRAQREDLKAKYGITTPFVLLSVGVIQREHKRTDYVIREAAAALGPDWSLLLCGAPSEPDLLDLGRQLLGPRFAAVSVPNESMGEIYRIADLFVLASLYEGFGLVIVEAMKHGLPVVLHKRPLFEWISEDSEACIDMSVSRALASFLPTATSPEWRMEKGPANRRRFLDRFSWDALAPQYVQLHAPELEAGPAPGTPPG